MSDVELNKMDFDVSVGTDQGAIKLINLKETTTPRKLQLPHRTPISSMCCHKSQDLDELWSLSENGCLAGIVAEGLSVLNLAGQSVPSKTVVCSYDHENLLIGSQSGQVSRWKLEGEEREPLLVDSFDVKPVSALQEITNETFAVGGKENELSVWDVVKGLPTFCGNTSRPDHLGVRRPVSVSRIKLFSAGDKSKLCTATEFGQIRTFDIRSGQRRPVVEFEVGQSKQAIRSLVVLANDNQLLAGQSEGSLGLYDLRRRRLVHLYRDPAGSVSDLAVRQDLVFSTCVDRFLRVHHLHTRELLAKVYAKSRLNCLTLNPRCSLTAARLTTDDQAGEEKSHTELAESEKQTAETVGLDDDQFWSEPVMELSPPPLPPDEMDEFSDFQDFFHAKSDLDVGLDDRDRYENDNPSCSNDELVATRQATPAESELSSKDKLDQQPVDCSDRPNEWEADGNSDQPLAAGSLEPTLGVSNDNSDDNNDENDDENIVENNDEDNDEDNDGNNDENNDENDGDYGDGEGNDDDVQLRDRPISVSSGTVPTSDHEDKASNSGTTLPSQPTQQEQFAAFQSTDDFDDFEGSFADFQSNDAEPVAAEAGSESWANFNETAADFAPADVAVEAGAESWANFKEATAVADVGPTDSGADGDFDDFSDFSGGFHSASQPALAESVTVDEKPQADVLSQLAEIIQNVLTEPNSWLNNSEVDSSTEPLHNVMTKPLSKEIWSDVANIEETRALQFHWNDAAWQQLMFSALHVNPRLARCANSASGVPSLGKTSILQPTPVWKSSSASQPLQPVQMPSSSADKSPSSQRSDRSDSSVQTPTTATNVTENLTTNSHTSSNLIDDLLADLDPISTNSSSEPVGSLPTAAAVTPSFSTSQPLAAVPMQTVAVVSAEQRDAFLKSLPNLSFMRSKVLQFPVT